MEFALLHLLFLMNAFDMTTENSIPFYRFRVNSVERCPMNASEFDTSARRRNCTGNYRYLCAPDRNLSSLIEFCTDTSRSLFGEGNCLRLEGTGNLNHYNCVERFVCGCPTEPYADDEIYKYPACLELDLDFNCFVADKNCQKRLLTSTDKYFNDSKDGNAEQETFDGSIKLQHVIVFVYGFLYVAGLTGTVAIYIYNREKYKKAIMPYKNRARRDDVATRVPPSTPPTEVQRGENGPKRTRKQSETDTVNMLQNFDYERLAKEIVNQQKAFSEKQNIGESVGQPPMVNSVEDTAPVVAEAIAVRSIPLKADAICVFGIYNGVESGQTDANKSKESKPISVNRERDRYRLEDEKEKYVYFWQNHSVFSHWYPCTFVIDGIKYNSAEQYMMHQKAEIMGDEDSAKAIMTLDDPSDIKKRGRRVKNFNQDIWGSCSQEIVKRGNMEKFSQNEELKQQLLWTHPKTLVEASPYDQIWGIGLSENDPKAWNKLTWRGKNLLGEILTTVRERLRRDIENAGPYGDSNDLDL